MTSACASLSVRLQYSRIVCHRKAGKANFPKGDDARSSGKELPDESEVLYVRKKLDGGVLPAKVIPEHAEHGRAYCKAIERGLGNNDGNLPFWKQSRIQTFCEARYHHSFVSKTSIIAESPSMATLGQTRVTLLVTCSIRAAPWVVICAAK